MRNKKMVFYTDMMLSLISFAVMSNFPFLKNVPRRDDLQCVGKRGGSPAILRVSAAPASLPG